VPVLSLRAAFSVMASTLHCIPGTSRKHPSKVRVPGGSRSGVMAAVVSWRTCRSKARRSPKEGR
jgi:hypothetical protein